MTMLLRVQTQYQRQTGQLWTRTEQLQTSLPDDQPAPLCSMVFESTRTHFWRLTFSLAIACNLACVGFDLLY